MEFAINHPDIGKATVILIFDGVPYEADSDHVWWEEIIDLLLEDDERVVDLFPKRPFQRPSLFIEDPELGPLDRFGRREAETELEGQRWVPTQVRLARGQCGYCGCQCGTPQSRYADDKPGQCGCGQSEFAGDSEIAGDIERAIRKFEEE